MKKIISKLSAPIGVIRIIKRYEPLYFVYGLPQVIISAVLPLLYVYAPKLIIEKLTDGSLYVQVIKVIGIYTLFLLILNVIKSYLNNKSSFCAERFSRKIKREIGIMTTELELKDVESTRTKEIIQLAGNATSLTTTMELIQNIIANVITILGLAYIIIQLDWLFLLMIAITLFIKSIFVFLQYANEKKIRDLDAKNNRVGYYLSYIAYFNEGGAKEIRVNNLQNWFLNKIKKFRKKIVKLAYCSFKLYSISNIIIAIVMALQSFVVLWLLSVRYLDRIINIADFTMYFSAIATLTTSLSSISEKIGQYRRQVLNVEDYNKLINIKNQSSNGVVEKTKYFKIPDKVEFEFHNVSFTYPNTDKVILQDINIKISNKEKLVIVGLNGAGKSTFIKLLCKFYHPTKGKITLNGIDIWNIPNEQYYKSIAAVFQDYTNFAFSLKENIFMKEDGDTYKVSKILEEVGLNEYVNELAEGYDTYISKQFDSSGTELSGGQGQKLAIARAIYKNSPVLILDEPTASLDPKAESEIYENFLNMAKDKTAIFISHRLAASTISDNIAVFSNGRIVEYGSHDTLMKKEGLYADMYTKQSKPYIDVKKIF